MKYYILLLVIAASLSSCGRKNHYKMKSSVHCQKTTEDGEDEIYMIIVWKTNLGLTGYKRVPVASDRYSISDDERFLNTLIYTDILDFDLAPGESIEIFYSLMEQDDGTAGEYEEIGNKISRSFKNSSLSSMTAEFYKNLMSDVASKYNLSNSDDWIGAFTESITIKDDDTWSENHPPIKLDNTNNTGITPKMATVSGKTSTFEFNGDGSHYFVSFSIEKK